MSKKLHLKRFWRVRIKKKFPEAISHRISKTNSTFHVR